MKERLPYHFVVCERPDMVGMTNHILLFFEKYKNVKNQQYLIRFSFQERDDLMLKVKKLTDYKVTKIEKGWSNDEKYLLETGKEKLLLRLTDISQYEKKKYEFEMFQKLKQVNVPTSRPIEFGIDDENKHVWMTLSWVEGEDLETQIQNFSVGDQYKFGIKAGKILQKIHAVEIPEPLTDWDVHFNKKTDKRLKIYDECEIKIPGADAFIAYIEQNRHLLKGRPQTFQHGDYHIGNMILTAENKVIPIDFNRLDTGDPWEEFNRILFCKDISPAFASGRVDGYFDGDVPDKFWQLLAFYISSNTLGGIAWALDFGEEEVNFSLKQAQRTLKDYDNMTLIVPKWYKRSDLIEKY